MKSITLTRDELVLVMISLVRATHPAMLRQEADGLSVDFKLLNKKKTLNEEESFLFKVRATLGSPVQKLSRTLQVDHDESRRMFFCIDRAAAASSVPCGCPEDVP